jgi:hypothetical protein
MLRLMLDSFYRNSLPAGWIYNGNVFSHRSTYILHHLRRTIYPDILLYYNKKNRPSRDPLPHLPRSRNLPLHRLCSSHGFQNTLSARHRVSMSRWNYQMAILRQSNRTSSLRHLPQSIAVRLDITHLPYLSVPSTPYSYDHQAWDGGMAAS